jgi:hypothetical protein
LKGTSGSFDAKTIICSDAASTQAQMKESLNGHTYEIVCNHPIFGHKVTITPASGKKL